MFWRIEVFLNKSLFSKKFRKRVQLGFSFSSADIAFLTWYNGCWNLQEEESDEDRLPPVVSSKFQTASVVNLVSTLFKKKANYEVQKPIDAGVFRFRQLS